MALINENVLWASSDKLRGNMFFIFTIIELET